MIVAMNLALRRVCFIFRVTNEICPGLTIKVIHSYPTDDGSQPFENGAQVEAIEDKYHCSPEADSKSLRTMRSVQGCASHDSSA